MFTRIEKARPSERAWICRAISGVYAATIPLRERVTVTVGRTSIEIEAVFLRCISSEVCSDGLKKLDRTRPNRNIFAAVVGDF